MASSIKKKTISKTKAKVNKGNRDYSNDPFFIKKRNEAEAFIKKFGLPEEFEKQKNQ